MRKNSKGIAQAVDDVVRTLGTNRNSVYLLFTDPAKYMVAAGALLQSLYPKLFHVICVAHLLRNCGMKVRSHFQDVDQLIAKAKLVTVENKTSQATLAAIGYSPKPVLTRWRSWLYGTSYSTKYLPEVKAIVKYFEGSGVLVTQPKGSLQTPSLADQLLKINVQYEIIKVIETM